MKRHGVVREFGKTSKNYFIALSLLLLFVLSSSSLTVSFAASTPSFSTPINLGSATAKAQNPNIAAAGSCVYVTFPEGSGLDVSSSSNNGVTMGSAVQLSAGLSGKNNFQRIWATGTDAYVTWEDSASGGAQNIYFSATTNCGVSWSAATKLNSVPIPSTCSLLCAQPTLTATGSDVYVTWTQQNPSQVASACKGCEDAYVVASTNNGASFGSEYYFGNPSYKGGAHEPEVSASGSNVFIVWDDSNLYFNLGTVSGGGTLTWQYTTTTKTAENALVLSLPNSAGALNREPHVYASGSTVYVIWETNYASPTSTGVEKTFIQVSQDSGSSFLSTPDVFGTHTWLPIAYPSGSNAYAAWGQIVKGTYQAEFIHSADSGATWSSLFNPPNSAGAHDTQLAASGALVYLMYFAGTGTQPTVIESTDGGTTFGSPVVISQGTGATTEVQNDQPQIVISGSEVCATWLQSVGGKQLVMYSYASSP